MASTSGYTDEDGATISEINVTPLVDVVLVLLIVFMITMPTIVAMEAMKERELDIRLPEASEALPMTIQPKEIIVNVKSTGLVVVNGDSLDRAGLANVLVQAATNNPDRVSVVIRADREALWDYVAAVMDLCHASGISDYRAAVAE